MKTKIPPGLFPPQQFAKILLGISKGSTRNDLGTDFFRCTIVSSGGFRYFVGFEMPPVERAKKCAALKRNHIVGIAHTIVQYLRDSKLRLEKMVNGFEFDHYKSAIVGCANVHEADFKLMRELVDRNFTRGRKKQDEMILFS